MTRRLNRKSESRLTDNLSFRVSPACRLFIEDVAKAHDCGICDAARLVLDEAMGCNEAGTS